MKISDERLQELIDKVGVSSLPLYGRDALAAFRELQQYREERRWRKLGVDELKTYIYSLPSILRRPH